MNKIIYLVGMAILGVSCQNLLNNKTSNSDGIVNKFDTTEPNTYYALRTITEPIIDGLATDSCWSQAVWDTLDQIWLGSNYSATDFTGRYKIGWNEKQLYLLIEITDDSLLNSREPLVNYWDDDCVEVFIDEDHSGGIHQYNYNAFAYHISPTMDAVDMGPDKKAHLYNSHVQGVLTKNGAHYLWELAISIYPDTYSDEKNDNQPVKLGKNKEIGFSIAYCDNDSSPTRENFIGSVNTDGHFKNDGWIDASCFGVLVLKE
ncbi:MAG: sugar-binding protein [Salinivirgaceae bacterium]